MVILSHPTGNTFVRAALRALCGDGALYAFYTAIAAPHRLGALRWLPAGVRGQLGRRRFDEVPAHLVHAHPWREAARLAAHACGVDRLTARGAPAHIDTVYQHFDAHVARQLDGVPAHAPVTAVYAYEDAADETFRVARRCGFACVYELPIAHWQTTRRLLLEEADRLPAWSRTLQGLDDPPSKLGRKDRELDQADTVVVPSRFVLESLPVHVRATRRCILAPFGSPAPDSSASHVSDASGRLRVLFAGALTQRKGLADLFEAIRRLGRSDVELVVMGSLMAPLSFYRSHGAEFVYEPPRPHEGVLALMRSCHVLALPAIAEGRALVQQEALASGLPLIVTRNAGADDLVEEGRTGFLVPIRDPDALAERIAWCADHRDALPEMQRAARHRAAQTGWRHYEAHVLEAVTA